jgi:hypothetical protein
MSTGKSSGDEADLAEFLARQSSISADYANLELVDPPAAVDEMVLASAKAAVRLPVAKSAPAAAPARAAGTPATGKPVPPTEAATPAAGAVNRRKRLPASVDGDVDEEAEPARRPRWLIPAALAATVLVAVGIGVSMLGEAPSGPDDGSAIAMTRQRRRLKPRPRPLPDRMRRSWSWRRKRCHRLPCSNPRDPRCRTWTRRSP